MRSEHDLDYDGPQSTGEKKRGSQEEPRLGLP